MTVRILQFAGCVNRHDFIDAIVQRADRSRFEVGVCVGTEECNIAPPAYGEQTPRWLVPWTPRRGLHAAAWRLARILRAWRADLLHTHHYDEAVIGWLATRVCRRTRLVIGRHYSDAIYRSSSGLKQRALLTVERLVNRAAHRIVAPSAYICEILTRWQGVDPRKVDRVPYGFVPEKYAPPPASDVEQLRADLRLNRRFVIANFARLHEEKGQRHLIEAAAALRQRVPELLVLIVGEGAERPGLERQIAAAGLSGVVRLLGWRRDAMAIMAAVDAVVQPTLQEAFSQVMAEALWMGKPLVMTDVSGAPDVIQDGVNGLLVPKGDPGAIAEAIGRLAQDCHLRSSLGAAGRAYVEQHLTVDRIIPRYEEVYLRAMGRLNDVSAA